MTLVREIRYAFRSISKSPGFAATAIVTLALGIGATTAIFSVCDAMLWKPVPLPHIESLVMVHQAASDDPRDFSDATPADAEDIRAQSNSFNGYAIYQQGEANIVAQGGEPERADQALVSAYFFDVLAVKPELGRGFHTGDDDPGAAPLVVFSDSFWRHRFGADPTIIGKTIRLDDRDTTVIGVMPASVNFPLPTEVWTPLTLSIEQRHSRSNQSVTPIARLKPGRTVQQAAAEIDGIARRLAVQYPDTNKNRRFLVRPAQEVLIGQENRQYALLLFWSVMFVLLIACGNVANLQYARATGRAREIAVRTALGAARWRLVTQVVLECVLLAVGGAVAGIAVAEWGLEFDSRRHAAANRQVHFGMAGDSSRFSYPCLHAWRRGTRRDSCRTRAGLAMFAPKSYRQSSRWRPWILLRPRAPSPARLHGRRRNRPRCRPAGRRKSHGPWIPGAGKRRRQS